MKRMTSRLTCAFEMQFENFVSGSHLFHIALAAMLAITFAGVAGAQEGRTGKVQQGLGF